jgi:hypothetical protein
MSITSLDPNTALVVTEPWPGTTRDVLAKLEARP